MPDVIHAVLNHFLGEPRRPVFFLKRSHEVAKHLGMVLLDLAAQVVRAGFLGYLAHGTFIGDLKPSDESRRDNIAIGEEDESKLVFGRWEDIAVLAREMPQFPL